MRLYIDRGVSNIQYTVYQTALIQPDVGRTVNSTPFYCLKNCDECLYVNICHLNKMMEKLITLLMIFVFNKMITDGGIASSKSCLRFEGKVNLVELKSQS